MIAEKEAEKEVPVRWSASMLSKTQHRVMCCGCKGASICRPSW